MNKSSKNPKLNNPNDAINAEINSTLMRPNLSETNPPNGAKTTSARPLKPNNKPATVVTDNVSNLKSSSIPNLVLK